MMRDRGSKVLGEVWFAWYWCACILQKPSLSLRAKGTDWGCFLGLLRTLWPTWQAFTWLSCLVYNAGKQHRTGNDVGDSLPGITGKQTKCWGVGLPWRGWVPTTWYASFGANNALSIYILRKWVWGKLLVKRTITIDVKLLFHISDAKLISCPNVYSISQAGPCALADGGWNWSKIMNDQGPKRNEAILHRTEVSGSS